ncbi:MAG: winged helix-turn-helix transcriptional regulator [Candidatus Hodarchaeales archaeon]
MALPFGIKKSKLKNLPPSTIAILKEFEQHEKMTTSLLSEHTGYSIRTIRYSLKTLLEEGIIEKQINLNNVRQIEYRIMLTTRAALRETRLSRIETDKLKSSITGQRNIK